MFLRRLYPALSLFAALSCMPWGSAEAATKANLRLKGIAITPTTSSVSVKLTVENAGGSAASSFWVDVFASPASMPTVGASSDGSGYISSIAAGSSKSVTITLSGWTQNTALDPESLYVLVDSDGQISESSESDNIFGQSMPRDSKTGRSFSACSVGLAERMPGTILCPACKKPDILDCPTCIGTPVCQDCGAVLGSSDSAVYLQIPGYTATTAPANWILYGWAATTTEPVL